jgi:hypothetical protein
MKYIPSLLATALLWTYALGWAAIGYPIYRDQHLGAAIEYSANGIDLLRPVITGFNATGTGTPQEFPIWQAAASLGMDAFGGWWGGATLASLILFTIFLPALYQTAKWEAGPLAAAIAIPLLLAQPIVFHLAGGAQTDGLALALLIGFIWSAEFPHRPTPPHHPRKLPPILQKPPPFPHPPRHITPPTPGRRSFASLAPTLHAPSSTLLPFQHFRFQLFSFFSTRHPPLRPPTPVTP